MSKWITNPNIVSSDCALKFGSWDELHRWLDSCDPDGKGYRGNSCPFIEDLFIIGCYQLYRNEELLDGVSNIYTDTNGISGKPFVILGEVPLNAREYDVESLPLWNCLVENEVYTLYPEEIFVNY